MLNTDNAILLPQKKIDNYTSQIIERLRCDKTLSSCVGLSCELCYAIIIDSKRDDIPASKLTSNIIMEIIISF